MSTLDVRVFDRTFTTELDVLEEETARGFLAEHSDCGTGRVEMLNDDPILATADYGTILRFDLDTTAQFAVLVEGRDTVSIDEGEEAAERTVVSGRGVLAVFEDAVVEPDLGIARTPIVDARAFDYGSADVDRTAWATPSTAGPIGAMPGVGEPDRPLNWHDDDAERIWAPTVDPLDPPVDDGVTYFWLPFTIADADTYRLEATADDGLEVKIDGRGLISETRPFLFKETKTADVFLDEGDHYLAAKVTNLARPASPSTNVAYFLATLWSLKTGGTDVDAVIVRTSDTDWLAIGYPADPPGVTVGKLIRVLVEEAQARGALDGVTLGFTDDDDTASVAWPVVADIVVQVGHDLLTVLRQLAETYCDIAMAADSLTLNAWVQRGTVTSVDLEEGSNLVRLVHQGVG